MGAGESEERRPLVSIVLPTYNGARYLRESIDSCLRQTYDNIELIIVNDGSTDETEEIILSYDDPRIVYAKHHPNAGMPRSLNAGFALAKGDYLTWTSDDNYYADNAIEVMLTELQRLEPKVQFVYCDYHEIDAKGQLLRTLQVHRPARIRWRNIVGPCFLYTCRVAEVVGTYNTSLQLAEDYEYWLRVFFRFRMCPIYMPLYYYRRHDESLTARYSDAQIKAARHARPSALRTAPGPRRVWECTAGSPWLATNWLRTVAYLEDLLRPRRRLRDLMRRFGSS